MQYGLKEVAELLGLPLPRARRLATLAGLPPDGPFAFPELAVLRALAGLAARVSPRRMHHALRRLPLEDRARVRFVSAGQRVVVRDDAGLYDPLLGQRLLDFDPPRPPADIAVLAQPAPAEGEASEADAPDGPAPTEADLRFAEALALEDQDPAAAAERYAAVLAEAPEHLEAHINLGRLLHEAGHLVRAEGHYRKGLELSPEDPVAWFNLGVLLDDREDLEAAIAAYREALRLDPRNADAHFNLARLLERQGDELAAMRHLSRYRQLQP